MTLLCFQMFLGITGINTKRIILISVISFSANVRNSVCMCVLFVYLLCFVLSYFCFRNFEAENVGGDTAKNDLRIVADFQYWITVALGQLTTSFNRDHHTGVIRGKNILPVKIIKGKHNLEFKSIYKRASVLRECVRTCMCACLCCRDWCVGVSVCTAHASKRNSRNAMWK